MRSTIRLDKVQQATKRIKNGNFHDRCCVKRRRLKTPTRTGPACDVVVGRRDGWAATGQRSASHLTLGSHVLTYQSRYPPFNSLTATGAQSSPFAHSFLRWVTEELALINRHLINSPKDNFGYIFECVAWVPYCLSQHLSAKRQRIRVTKSFLRWWGMLKWRIL